MSRPAPLARACALRGHPGTPVARWPQVFKVFARVRPHARVGADTGGHLALRQGLREKWRPPDEMEAR
jgi:hypothetical protein